MAAPFYHVTSARPEINQHKRSTSSVLKSIINPLGHRRNASNGATLANQSFDQNYGIGNNARVLGETTNNKSNMNGSPYGQKTSHKKTLSSVSLASIVGKDDNGKKARGRSKTTTTADGSNFRIQKPKSQTGLAALFARPKLSKAEPALDDRNKENSAPGSSTRAEPPPIWAQFATTAFPASQDHASLDTGFRSSRDLSDEIALYTPSAYGIDQQRNFHNFAQPSLSRRSSGAGPERRKLGERPHSIQIPASSSASTFREALQNARKPSNEQDHQGAINRPYRGHSRTNSNASNDSRVSAPIGRKSSVEVAPKQAQRVPDGASREKLTIAKRGARVMAAVAAFNNKSKPISEEAKPEPLNIDAAFEALLDSRNTPANTKAKMLGLDAKIKLDLINQDKAGKSESTLANAPVLAGKPDHGHGAMSPKKGGDNVSPGKRARPRSKTFSMQKRDRNESPSKRHKSGEAKEDDDPFLTTGQNVASASSPKKSWRSSSDHKRNAPEEFVAYLKKVQKPQSVEIGKLHKLRLVLRVERVEWVEEFVSIGGMDELVGLLHRIIEVEWREEHEDLLMHEALLCLKALCTTEAAMRQLAKLQDGLFPALLKMLFDEERKGPSEFTTRGLIIRVIFQYLAGSSPEDLTTRARILLEHFRDPKPEEDTLNFITSMHQPRPYRQWCREVTGVTKEVFWIFLHGTNVVSHLPPADPAAPYVQSYFPESLPPVPAAPHVGGIEWEAMGYLADHLDMINGILASLATATERNHVRQEFKSSGFEKTMGMSLRTCKEKFYPGVHAALRTWVAAARADSWNYRDVRNGPPVEERRASPRKAKPSQEGKVGLVAVAPPKLDLPKLDFLGGQAEESKENGRPAKQQQQQQQQEQQQGRDADEADDGWML